MAWPQKKIPVADIERRGRNIPRVEVKKSNVGPLHDEPVLVRDRVRREQVVHSGLGVERRVQIGEERRDDAVIGRGDADRLPRGVAQMPAACTRKVNRGDEAVRADIPLVFQVPVKGKRPRKSHPVHGVVVHIARVAEHGVAVQGDVHEPLTRGGAVVAACVYVVVAVANARRSDRAVAGAGLGAHSLIVVAVAVWGLVW